MSKQGHDSPCIRNCCLDDNDICIGCGRRLDEITGWREANEAEQVLILRHAKQRLKERQNKISLVVSTEPTSKTNS